MLRYSRGSLTFDVLDRGPRTGDAVVLLHGFPQNATAFDEVTPALTAAGLRTLAPTQRGYAPTARPRWRGSYRMPELVDDVLALLDAVGLERAHVVGHDWGGAQAWALAAWHPQRVASMTVLSTPHPAAMTASLVLGDQALRSWYIGAFQVPYLPDRLLAPRLQALLDRSGLPTEHARRYAAALCEPGALAGALGWYRGIPFSANAGVGQVTVPTTYVWGNRDTALGRRAAERTERHVSAPYRFVELPAGHWLPEKHPQEVAAAVLDRIGL